MRCLQSAVVWVAVGAAASVSLAGPDWSEVSDAGSFAGLAQSPVGIGAINTISGALSLGVQVPDFEDMYFIRIVDPVNFRARILGGGFDAKLYLFTPSGGSALGLLGNANGPGGENALLLGAATDASGAAVPAIGDYYLSVCGAGDIPVSSGGGIYSITGTEISGPDGPGGALSHSAWNGVGQTGEYVIELQGVVFVPAPGSVALLGGLGCLMARRRRG